MDTFQTGFCDMSYYMITFTSHSVKMTTLVAFKILAKMKYAICIMFHSIKRVTFETTFQNTKNDHFQI